MSALWDDSVRRLCVEARGFFQTALPLQDTCRGHSTKSPVRARSAASWDASRPGRLDRLPRLRDIEGWPRQIAPVPDRTSPDPPARTACWDVEFHKAIL